MKEVRKNGIISIAGLSKRRGNREETERRAGQKERGCGLVCACACIPSVPEICSIFA